MSVMVRDILGIINSLYCIMYNKSDNGNKLLSFCVWVFFSHFQLGPIITA